MSTTSSSLTPETLSHITELLKSSPDDSILQELSEMKEILTRASEPSSTSVVPEWQADLLDSMDSQRKQIALLEEEITRAVHVLGDITKSASNLDESVGRLGDRTDTGFNELNSKLENSQLEGMVKEGGEKVGQVEEAVKALQVKVESGYDKLAKEMKGLSNVESVLLDTGDSVLDTKRRLEYGVQQILGELNSQIKESTRTLNGSLQGRFDSLATAVLGNQTKSLTNLTARMEEEISQVWRQIGILYHQMSRSANLLDDIHSQTSKYVNNSLDTMTSMDGKVGQITNRMGEVDDNLNYLLGRMSLVVQEFNMIKNGLGDALVGLKEGLEGQTGGEGGGEGVGENAIQ